MDPMGYIDFNFPRLGPCRSFCWHRWVLQLPPAMMVKEVLRRSQKREPNDTENMVTKNTVRQWQQKGSYDIICCFIEMCLLKWQEDLLNPVLLGLFEAIPCFLVIYGKLPCEQWAGDKKTSGVTTLASGLIDPKFDENYEVEQDEA